MVIVDFGVTNVVGILEGEYSEDIIVVDETDIDRV